MRVSARHAFMAAFFGVALIGSPVGTPEAAAIGGGSSGGGSGNCGTTCGGGGHGGGGHCGGGGGCGGGGHRVRPPNITIHGPRINVGVNVNTNVSVNTTVNANANANAGAGAGAGASGGATAIAIGGGGGGSFGAPPPATAITGLTLAGVIETEMVAEERTRVLEEWRVIRAVCMDDRGTPHPASRPDPDERVSPDWDGEIFRCVAGTWMQVTIGWRVDGADVWDDAFTMACERGEALRHQPGGRLYCATQEPRRNCNERSLLRQYGPGVRVVYLRREETYTEMVEHRREVSSATNMTLMLDGGVGGYR